MWASSGEDKYVWVPDSPKRRKRPHHHKSEEEKKECLTVGFLSPRDGRMGALVRPCVHFHRFHRFDDDDSQIFHHA